MFFVSNIFRNKVGVADTSDCVVEYFTLEELANIGVSIEGFDLNTLSAIKQDVSSLISEDKRTILSERMGYKLYRQCIKDSSSLFEYLISHYIFGLHDYIYSNDLYITKNIRCFSFAETLEMFVITIEVVMPNSKRALIVLKLYSNGAFRFKLLGLNPENRYCWFQRDEPIGSGYMYKLRVKSETGKDICLNDKSLYMKIYYNKASYILLSLADFSIGYKS